MFEQNKELMRAEILTIGNEVVSGLIQDSNSQFLSSRLNSAGVNVRRMTSVGDDPEDMVDALNGALERVDLILVTGGLGSTHDDLTKQVLAQRFGHSLVMNDTVLRRLESIMASRGKAMTPGFRSQAEVPDKAEILHNAVGSAPGLLFQHDGKKVYALPGVPKEMRHLYEKYIHPELEANSSGRIAHRLLRTTGLSESELWPLVGGVEELERWVSVASLPSYEGVKIRLSASGKNREETLSKIEQAERWLVPKIEKYIFARDDELMEEVIGRLLLKESKTLGLAESCTGGLIGHRLTQVPGSSAYFIQGAVVYSNEAKMRLLGVSEETLRHFGAVSRETALEMAKGICERSGSDYGLAVTGILGPGGGSEEKPVGLTFIAVADSETSHCEEFRFHQDRKINKERAAQAALNLLRLRLLRVL
ncbi:MAG: competence/damage-inducible protein A [Candidatus Nitrohelix vancouverensis]|uniref:CinA-like protein n=1 Tax=Candidatus Nitrohelix vancouverensis TaxID=2705534 RepID=A0A7T0C2P8_9BACT|nr:MAG: competence/damage-inducible protein A [Candidatus Nitrohelix vancouverensis]